MKEIIISKSELIERLGDGYEGQHNDPLERKIKITTVAQTAKHRWKSHGEHTTAQPVCWLKLKELNHARTPKARSN